MGDANKMQGVSREMTRPLNIFSTFGNKKKYLYYFMILGTYILLTDICTAIFTRMTIHFHIVDITLRCFVAKMVWGASMPKKSSKCSNDQRSPDRRTKLTAVVLLHALQAPPGCFKRMKTTWPKSAPGVLCRL